MKYGSLSRRAVLKTVLSSVLLAGCQSTGIRVASATASEPPASTSTGTPTASPTPPSTPSPTFTPSATPYQPIISPSPVIAISAGGTHSLALREDGKVWGWGRAANLGVAGEYIYTPILLDHVKDIVYIDTDEWRTSLFVDKDGQIFRAGYPDEMASLTRLEGISGVIKAKAVHDTVVALRSDGSVWAYGEKEAGLDGLLGLSVFEETGQFVQLPIDNVVDILVMFKTALMLRTDGTVWMWGLAIGDRYRDGEEIFHLPQPHPDVLDAIGVTYGLGLCTIRSDGVVIQDRAFAVYPLQEMFSNASQVDGSPRAAYNLIVDSNGNLWGWGFHYGMLTLSDTDFHSYIDRPVNIPMSNRIVEVSAGTSHILALDKVGTVWSWGSNFFGQLGIGMTEAEYLYTPVPVLYSQ